MGQDRLRRPGRNGQNLARVFVESVLSHIGIVLAMVWSRLIWSDLGWSGLIWSGLVRTDLFWSALVGADPVWSGVV